MGGGGMPAGLPGLPAGMGQPAPTGAGGRPMNKRVPARKKKKRR